MSNLEMKCGLPEQTEEVKIEYKFIDESSIQVPLILIIIKRSSPLKITLFVWRIG